MKRAAFVLLVLLSFPRFPLAAQEWYGLKISDAVMSEIQPQYLNGTIPELLGEGGVVEQMLASGKCLMETGLADSGSNVTYTHFLKFHEAVVEGGESEKGPILLSLVNKDGRELATWELLGGWPSKVESPTAREKGRIEFSFTGARRIR